MIFMLSTMGSSCLHSKTHFAGTKFKKESTAWVLVRSTVLGHGEPRLCCAFVKAGNALRADGPWIHGFCRVRAQRYTEVQRRHCSIIASCFNYITSVL